MAKIPKKLQKLPEHESKGESKENKKGYVKAHDPRFRDEWGIGEMGLDKKTRKRMSRAKKLTSRGI